MALWAKFDERPNSPPPLIKLFNLMFNSSNSMKLFVIGGKTGGISDTSSLSKAISFSVSNTIVRALLGLSKSSTTALSGIIKV